MADDHLELAILRRYAAQKLSRQQMFEAGWHLFLCEDCRARLPEVSPEAETMYRKMFGTSELTYPESAYGEVTRAVAEKLQRTGVEIERERASAGTLWAELREHPPPRRLLMVENSSRFQSYGLAELLVQESRHGWIEDPARSEDLAKLALTVIHRLERRLHGPALLNDLKAEAWSYIANCRRFRSDLRSVSEAFDIAEDFRTRGTGDLMEEAEILQLKASFYRDQRRFQDALRAVDRAIEIFRQAEDHHAEGRALIKKATVLRQAGEPENTLPLLERAASLVDPVREPRLLLMAHQNMALSLNETGQAMEARKLLTEARKLAIEVGGDLDRIRILWIEGLVNRELGQTGLAEAALRRAMTGFIKAGIGYDAALVAIDLAALYLESERAPEARDLAGEMAPIFASRDVHREAVAAAGPPGPASLSWVLRWAVDYRRADPPSGPERTRTPRRRSARWPTTRRGPAPPVRLPALQVTDRSRDLDFPTSGPGRGSLAG